MSHQKTGKIANQKHYEILSSHNRKGEREGGGREREREEKKRSEGRGRRRVRKTDLWTNRDRKGERKRDWLNDRHTDRQAEREIERKKAKYSSGWKHDVDCYTNNS